MKILTINLKNMKFLILYIILFTTTTFAQNSDENMNIKSKYSAGFSIGYTGLLKINNSSLTQNVNGTSLVNGPEFGFIFEYKFGGLDAAVQIVSEANYINFKKDNENNYEIISFNSIGIKVKPSKIMFYLIPAVGILTGKETLFIKSFSIGYDFIKSENSNYFMQLGLGVTDGNNNFFMFRMGMTANL